MNGGNERDGIAPDATKDAEIPPSPVSSVSVPAAEPAFVLRLFGVLALSIRGQDVPVLSRSGRSLIALLAVRGGERPLERDFVARTLWPDSDDAAARYNLRRTLAEVRAALGEEANRLIAPAAGSPRTLRLDLVSGSAFCDVAAFDSALARGRDWGLQTAVDLYASASGSLLEGERGDWVFPEREARRESYLDARLRLARSCRERGEISEAISHLRAVLMTDSAHEAAVRDLMRALSETGQAASAMAAYQNLRTRLHEIGAVPDSETTELYGRIYRHVQQSAARQRAGESGVTGGGEAASPAGVAFDNLPRSLSPLIGRERDILEVITSLKGDKDRPPARLVTLLGPGGTGKTRLSLAVAELVTASYEDGVCFVDFAPVEATAPLFSVVSDTLRLTLPPASKNGKDGIRSLAEALRLRRMLLIFDNCEHVTAGAAHLAMALLRACPHLTVLSTSREPLHVPGETVCRVSGLAPNDAARLFLVRATEADSAFRPQPAQAETVREIVARLDGIPLAIEMAAARVRALPLAEILKRLDNVFRLLTTPGGDLQPRHQTLQATLDWSYDLLEPAEQTLLCRLSVFAGGWTLAAAEAVYSGNCGDGIEESGVLKGLSSLVDKSLVVFDRGAKDEINGEQYRFLETVRQYAREKLSASDAQARLYRRRHAEYYSTFAKTTRNKLFGPGQGLWLSRLDAAQDNLRAAMAFFLGETETGSDALVMAIALHSYWLRSGRAAEGLRMLEAALEFTENSTNSAAVLPVDRANALDAAGVLAGEMGDLSTAIAYHERAIDVFQRIDASFGIATALNHLGLRRQEAGELEAADGLLAESAQIMRSLNDSTGLANAISNRGNGLYYGGDFSGARALFSEALSIYQSTGDTRRAALVSTNLGMTAQKQGDYDTARRVYREGLAVHRSLNDRQGTAFALYCIGLLYCLEGDYREARSCLRESLAIRWDMHYRLEVYKSLEALGELSWTEGNMSDSARLWAAGEALRISTGGKSAEDAQKRAGMIAAAKAAIDETEFAAAWAQGSSWREEEAVLFALAL